MDEHTQGVVLRTHLLTETSLIVHWLTEHAGRLATVARGARRPKSPFRGKLDLCFEADFTFRRSRRSDLHTLCEVALRRTFPALRTDWLRLSQAAYGVALVELATEPDTPVPEVWAVFREFLDRLDARPAGRDAVVLLELRLLSVLGLQPDLRSIAEPHRDLAAGWTAGPWPDLGPGPDAMEAVERLVPYLHGFLNDHLGRIPKGRAEALRVGLPPGGGPGT